ncbi:hypothetical protein PIB30_021751 [Stylosanthes scabra]|uniref:Uncharacterized protein n=1 Tax=Stylosanthes scabra TaxID=79078 RepID=A0ABU6T8R8_9FABA|nr:hypothetical protein [Stylosanthes scabra]
MPTSNANEVTVDMTILIHSIMEGLSIKAELLISHHISAAAESKDPNKRLPFTGVIYRLVFANGFKKKVQGDKLILIEKPITAESIMRNRFMEGHHQIPPQLHHQVQEGDEQEQQHQQEQHFQPHPQQFDFPQPPQQSFPQEYNWQELTQQFQGMRVEQNNQFKDFFDRQNNFFEDMRTQTKAYKQGFEDLRGRLPEDIPEWMQANVQVGRGRFSDGMSHIPRNCWPGATSAGAASTSKNVEDKGKCKAEEGDNDECGKKKAWEARDKDLNE